MYRFVPRASVRLAVGALLSSLLLEATAAAELADPPAPKAGKAMERALAPADPADSGRWLSLAILEQRIYEIETGPQEVAQLARLETLRARARRLWADLQGAASDVVQPLAAAKNPGLSEPPATGPSVSPVPPPLMAVPERRHPPGATLPRPGVDGRRPPPPPAGGLPMPPPPRLSRTGPPNAH